MTFSKVSVLVPTRKRLLQLQRLLDSFDATVTDADSAEILFRIDDDDAETAALLEQTHRSVICGSRYDGYRSLPRFLDELCAVATGDVFLGGNDDMRFLTPDWPAKLLAAANQFPDGLFALGVDTYNASVFPWPCLSRSAVERMGSLFDARCVHGDLFVRDVMATFEGAVRVPDVAIAHDWMGFTPDQTFLEGQQDDPRLWDDAYWRLHQAAVWEAVDKLGGSRQ